MPDDVVTYEVLTRELRASETRITKQLLDVLAPVIESARQAHIDESATQSNLIKLANDLGTLEGTMKTWSDQYKTDRLWHTSLLAAAIIVSFGAAISVLTGCLERKAEATEDATPPVVAQTATPMPGPTATHTPTPLPPIVEATPLPTSLPFATPTQEVWTPIPALPEIELQPLPDVTYYVPINRLRVRSGPGQSYQQVAENGVLLFACAGCEYVVVTKMNLPNGDEWLCFDEDCTRVVAYKVAGKVYGELRKP